MFRNSLKSFIVLTAITSGAAFAASTGTLILQGVVGVYYNLAVSPDGSNNTSLDILAGESGKSVANVLEQSNDPNGYKISFLSANAGLLKNGVVDQVSYQIKYGSGGLVSPSATYQTVFTSGSMVSPASQSQNVKVSFAAKPGALAGTYSDTLTFQIAAP